MQPFFRRGPQPHLSLEGAMPMDKENKTGHWAAELQTALKMYHNVA